MAHGEGQPAAEYAFDVVLRGYDRRQVDDHIGALDARLAATGRECSELRMQRDAEASRARDLEGRLRGGGPPPQSLAGTGPLTVSAPPPAAPGESWSLDGLGAKVESILRVAAEEADAIRRSAEASTRQHAEAEVRVRSTFEGISERLQPLVARLDEESAAARSAVQGTASDATDVEATARQQAQTMLEAATATAARMRADAETRVDVTARQAADVREELALVRQILTSLGAANAADSGGPADAGAAATADPTGPMDATGPVQMASRSGEAPSMAGAPSPQTTPVSTLPTPGSTGSPVSISTPERVEPASSEPASSRPDSSRPDSSRPEPAEPESSPAGSSPPDSSPPEPAEPESSPAGSSPPASSPPAAAPSADVLPPGFRGRQPRPDGPRPAASDAPTETIALPLIESDQSRQGGYPSPGRSQQQSG